MKVLLIVGESGAGKSTLAKYLKKKYNYHIVRSYTTRSKRNDDDNDHIFISKGLAKEMLNKEDVVAHTIINGEDYFTTVFNFMLNTPNAYIVDAKGVNHVKMNCPNWDVKLLKIKTNENTASNERQNRDIVIPEDSECDLIIERIVSHKYNLYKKNVKVPKQNWGEVL